MAQSQNSASLLSTERIKQLHQPRIAIVYTEWNEQIVAEQLKGCDSISEAVGGIITHRIAVPGSFELPFATMQLWEATQDTDQEPEAIICFGAVIRGGTPHFDYVCKAVTEGILHLNLNLPVPVIFGVLTLDSEAQAWERLGGVHGHKGEEAAITAFKMIANSRMLHGNPA